MRRTILLVTGFILVFSPGFVLGLETGDRAPLFEGTSTQGQISLQDFLGKKHVILAFYFADFTPV
ncbi:MAG: redoxin domain-containing protein [Nitrospiraceae bacterium]|nr:MAG: redoxin domain-containing protein [Nitrospiraceae bacterium]